MKEEEEGGGLPWLLLFKHSQCMLWCKVTNVTVLVMLLFG